MSIKFFFVYLLGITDCAERHHCPPHALTQVFKVGVRVLFDVVDQER